MKTKRANVFLITILLLVWFAGFSQVSRRPFPQHSAYFKGVIVPNHIAQKELDDSVVAFYHQWEQRYVRKSSCSESYYVWSENSGKDNECVSEGQGYGMMIVAMMSTVDRSEQNLFDGLFRYYQAHPSSSNRFLMSWAQSNNCGKFEESSASDGDIDIAYSLLLADAQWTSKGEINYKLEADNIINAIQEQEVNSKSFNILQSNSIESDSPDYFDMRSSDFIPSAFRVFAGNSSSKIWDKVIDSNYQLFSYLQKTYSSGAGLIPDFIKDINTKPVPVKGFYLESKYDGFYNYNACRVPWRIATDYIVDGENRAKQFVEPLNKWIMETTTNNPDNISSGYTLAGDDLKERNYEALSFISSFGVAAMVDSKNQLWLNKLWDYMIHFKLSDFDYYDNSIKMLAIIIMSHNYWTPNHRDNNLQSQQ
jgi:endo-1,4-beta-D-glucanase Y